MEKVYEPLVSVAIVTYNSSKTISETLDSVYAQTYQNIELIISDDHSKDETVSICEKWIDDRKERFVRCEIITAPTNTGVSANYNRAFNACKGEWIKDFDGDDIMLPNCVTECVSYIIKHPDTQYLFAKHDAFGADTEYCKKINNNFDYTFFSLTQEEQLSRMIFGGNCIPSTTAFYNREYIKQIGVTNDERIPLLEDWPKWINLIRAGVKFHFIDKVLVKYRVSETALSTSSVKSTVFIKSEALLYKYYRFPYFYRQGDKKDAVLKLLQAEKSIHDNAFIWRVIVFLYKKLTGIGNKTQQ